jgi:hypothetical protein
MAWKATRDPTRENRYLILNKGEVVGAALVFARRTIAWLGKTDFVTVAEVQALASPWAISITLPDALAGLRRKVEGTDGI